MVEHLDGGLTRTRMDPVNQAATHLSTTALPATLAGDPLSTFMFGLTPVRVCASGGELLFVANDVARALQLSDAKQALEKLDDDERGMCSVPTPGGPQVVRAVTESGLYVLIMRSRKATETGSLAHRFRKWVTAEVLPTIRKTGSYGASVPAPVDPMAMLQDVDVLIPLLATMAQRVKVAEAAVEASRPAVEFVGALADSDGLWGLRAAGKALHQGPDKFIKWLRDRKDLYDLDDGPVPKQHLINRGLFTVVWREFGGKQRPTTKLTGRGIVHYARELGVRPPGAPAQALLPGF